ncbi:MAG: hypothetical protein Q4F72_00435 [Desulfovibrionaceae bacterium]|nr:hypothetical protein [Desulfovibrionaceae bacterium]
MQHFAASSGEQTSSLPAEQRGPGFLTGAVACLLLTLCLMPAVKTAVAPHADSLELEPGWVGMPAGARSAYLGIHGGTVPVSLLVTSTGTSLISFVGQTGNDFLALLRKAELRLPSFLNNATDPRGGALPGGSGAREHITAGTPMFSLPVIPVSDESVFKLAATPGMLQPFGLSDTPLVIEGDVTMPSTEGRHPRYHIQVDPQYLQPR